MRGDALVRRSVRAAVRTPIRLIAGACLLTGLGCGAPQEGFRSESSRVWSSANSQDGYAACPQGTTVTGGGFEMKESDMAAGHVPLVTASKPDGNGWRVVCEDATGKWVTACRAWAVCASVLAR